MLFIVAALMLFGVLVGAAVHLPLPATVAAAAVIAAWLLAFAVRERLARH